jgi:hypothetical protein
VQPEGDGGQPFRRDRAGSDSRVKRAERRIPGRREIRRGSVRTDEVKERRILAARLHGLHRRGCGG